MESKIRIDKYLWSIRLFKTRALACQACDSNRVLLNGNPVKPSRTVNVGDVYEVRAESRKWLIKVTALLKSRVNYELAQQHYEDLSTDEMKQTTPKLSSSFYTGKRLSKTGKPTKKERRSWDKFIGDDSDLGEDV